MSNIMQKLWNIFEKIEIEINFSQANVYVLLTIVSSILY